VAQASRLQASEYTCRQDAGAPGNLATARHLMLQTDTSILIHKERLRYPWTPFALKA
jgi:hypothetical protein